MAAELEPMTAGLRAMTFVGAVFAALIAAQLYCLVRSGEAGQGLRSIIIGALVFAVWALVNFANTYFTGLFNGSRMSLVQDVLQAVFAILFAAGMWSQRQAFYRPERLRPRRPADDDDEAEEWFERRTSKSLDAA